MVYENSPSLCREQIVKSYRYWKCRDDTYVECGEKSGERFIRKDTYTSGAASDDYWKTSEKAYEPDIFSIYTDTNEFIGFWKIELSASLTNDAG